MIPVITLAYVFRLLFLLFLFTDFSSDMNVKQQKEQGFAVVELFTSEGCSSCPSADAAMVELSKQFSDNVYFLGYHVDYWNYLGWKDEYSNKVFTKRQLQYANKFNLNSIYTPQVVINGKTEIVGSDKTNIQRSITEDLKNQANISIDVKAKLEGPNKINVTYGFTHSTPERLNIALVQLMATTQVKRGENKGRELHHINIVREMKTANAADSVMAFDLPINLTAKDLKIIAFIQNKDNLSISGATETFISKGN